MKIFIDCEWNGYRGELISIAMVTELGEEFYREVEFSEKPEPWIVENVLPHLEGNPIHIDKLRVDAANFLNGCGPVEIIADWPEDISRLIDLLVCGPGVRRGPDTIKFSFFGWLGGAKSERPHHALYDAIAVKDSYLSGQAALSSNTARMV